MLRLSLVCVILSTTLFSENFCSAFDQESYEKIAKSIDENEERFIDRLKEAVRIPSVCAEIKYREDVHRMVNWTQSLMESLGIECEQVENELDKLIGDNMTRLGPVLFGILGKNSIKKTLLVYSHIDVQPAEKNDGWNTEPFEPTMIDGKMYGRGASDAKGMALTWLNTIETMQKLGIEIPVNIKFVFESQEECGSQGLDKILESRQDFLANVDMSLISDGTCTGAEKPCLTYGLRGINYFFVNVTGPRRDLHSGILGGSVYEPMHDLIWILSQLVDNQGNILIEGIYDLVAPSTKEEMKLYDNIDFDLEIFKKELGVDQLTSENATHILMKRWRYPALSIHGIQGAYSGDGTKNFIPASVVGKFSIRTVPNMEPEKVNELIDAYLEKLWKQRGSPNKFKVTNYQSSKYWLTNPLNDTQFKLASKAIERVYGEAPYYIREGGGIPPALTIERLTKKSLMMLPLGAFDDGAHSTNEKFDMSHYLRSMKLQASFLLELKNYA